MIEGLPDRPLIEADMETLNESGRFLPAYGATLGESAGTELYLGLIYLGEEIAVSLVFDGDAESWRVLERSSLEANPNEMMTRVEEWFAGEGGAGA